MRGHEEMLLRGGHGTGWLSGKWQLGETASDVEQSGTWEDQGQSQGRGGHQSLGIRVMGV